MCSRIINLGLLAVSTVLLPVSAAWADKLSPAEIAKRAKAAIALVEAKKSGTSATAFCVHPSGIFATCHRAVAMMGNEDLTVVLNAGQQNEKRLKASIIRADKELDLALLQVEGAKDLPVLELGPTEDINELQHFYPFGYASGRSRDKKEPPAVTAQVVRVASLRKKDKDLHRIDMIGTAGQAAPAGGPVLNDNAKVIGVVETTVQRRPTVGVIPANLLAKYLAAPEIRFVPPAIGQADLRKPVEFQARIVPIVPSTEPITVELLLRADDGQEQKHKMAAKDGTYSVRATPIPFDPRGSRLEIAARFANGSISGTTADRTIMVGGKPLKLSQATRIDLEKKPLVTMGRGKPLGGPISGLDEVEMRIGEQVFKANLSKAVSIQVIGPVESREVECAIIVQQGGKEVGRSRSVLTVQGVVKVQPADLSKVVIKPPAQTGVARKLPAVASDVAVGGAGRYLVLHLPKLKKLAIFDVNEAKVIHYLPVADDNIRYAAGLEKLIVGLPGKGILERWDIATGKRELANTIPVREDIYHVLMGSASNGPVLVNGTFFDVGTLRPLPIRTPQGVPGRGVFTSVSADGTVFGSWQHDRSATFVLEGNELKRFGGHGGPAGHMVPGPDGKFVYGSEGIYTEQLMPIKPKGEGLGYTLPAMQGNYFVSLTSADRNTAKGGGVTVYLAGQDKPVVKFDRFNHGLVLNKWDREPFGSYKRVFFMPKAKVLIILPATSDELVLHRLDIDEALEKSNIDYLLVTSQPPKTVKPGTTYTYQVDVKSRKGGLKYSVSSSLPGLEISPTGLIKWQVPAGNAVMENNVVLTIRDAAGQEVFQTFAVRVVKE